MSPRVNVSVQKSAEYGAKMAAPPAPPCTMVAPRCLHHAPPAPPLYRGWCMVHRKVHKRVENCTSVLNPARREIEAFPRTEVPR